MLEHGYTYVMVDLPGFGGSARLQRLGRPGRAAGRPRGRRVGGAQPWSTGKVGLFGKSYDGWTGLMGIAQQPKGLAAVVSMEPVYDGYRYLYMNGVRFPNSAATPALFQLTDAKPGLDSTTPDYLLNGTGRNAACYALNIGQQQQRRPDRRRSGRSAT